MKTVLAPQAPWPDVNIKHPVVKRIKLKKIKTTDLDYFKGAYEQLREMKKKK